MKLLTLLSSLLFYKGDAGNNPTISNIQNDHRKVTPGSLFICVKGYTVDGHDLAAEAVARGACAVIAEKQLNLPVPVIVVQDTYRAMAVIADHFYGHPTGKMNLVGITGTNGKTTTSHLIEKLLKDRQQKTGIIGTMYTKIGDTVLETRNTTPDSVTLQQIFSQMIDEGVQSAVMEVSSHALELGRVHRCDYDVAVLTNVTQDHLDFHKTMENYKHAKTLLFSQLGNSFTKPKFAVINNDDEAAVDFIHSTAANVLTYGIDQQADVRARNISITSKGTSFTIDTADKSIDIELQLVGKFSVYNVLAATAVGLCFGLELEQIKESLEEVQGVPGRFELISEGQDYTVIVDYAHTPDSLENVLLTVNEFAEGRSITVVGCGGDRDKTKRPLMAKIACKYSDFPIFTSDNPRSEQPADILADMAAGVEGEVFEVIEDRKKAIETAISEAKKGDVIMIAGKGHETYQQIGQEKIHFDDREIAREAIRRTIEK